MRPKPVVALCPESAYPPAMPLGFGAHSEGISDNSPRFQPWVRELGSTLLPKGRLTHRAASAVPSGLVTSRTPVPNVETLGYSQMSLQDMSSARAREHAVLIWSGRPKRRSSARTPKPGGPRPGSRLREAFWSACAAAPLFVAKRGQCPFTARPLANCSSDLVFRISDFGFRISFGFRVSDFFP